jgi:ABC-type amino acid transport substrate-binding protein
MEGLRSISRLMLVLALGALAQPRSALADDSIEILVGRTPPNVRWEGDRLTGYWVELSRLAAQKADVSISRFLNMPYQRSLVEVANGSNQCHPFVARTPKNEQSYRWVAPTRRLVTTVFVTADLPDPPKTIEDLRRYEIAVQRETLGDHVLEELGIPATRVTDTDRLAVMLAHRRVSVFVAEYASGFASAREASVAVKEAMPIAETLGYFVCSPRIDHAIAARLMTAINNIFAAGLDRPLAAADGMDAAIYDRVRPPVSIGALQPTQ